MTQQEFILYLRQQAEVYTQRGYAALLGVSPAYINSVLLGNREPGRKILDGAGFERVISYRRKDHNGTDRSDRTN